MAYLHLGGLSDLYTDPLSRQTGRTLDRVFRDLHLCLACDVGLLVFQLAP